MSGSNIKFVALVTAVCLLADSMLYVVLPIYPEQFGLSSLWEVGVLLSINRFVRIPIHPFVKKFYERYPTRQGLLVGLILTIVSTLLYGLMDNFLWLLSARILWGVAWAFLRQGGQLTVIDAAHESDQQSGSLTGLYNGISRTGSLLGMLMGGITAGLVGADTLCFVFAGAAIVLVPFLVRNMRNHSTGVEKAQFLSTLAVRETRNFRELLILLMTGFMVSLIYQGLLKSTLGYWVTIHDSLTSVFLGGLGAAAWTGILQGLRWGLEPIAAPWIGRMADRLASKLIILAPTLLLASFLFILLPASIPTVIWLFAIVLLLFTAVIVSTLVDASVVDYAAGSAKHAVVAHYLTASDLGAALGPAIGFLLIELAGASSVAWGGAIILLFTTVLVGWEHRNVTKETLKQETHLL